MIIKGNACAGGDRVAAHVLRTDTNEKVQVLEVRGTTSENLFAAFREMEAVASGTRCKRSLYHASINTRADEPMTAEQRDRSIAALEEKLGFEGQPRAVIMHEKFGRAHYHIVWSRIDIERMVALRIDHNYRKHEEVARQLEREFGHERVQGAHAEREGVARPDRTPDRKEMAQIERGGVKPQEAKLHVTTLWEASEDGRAFASALEQSGWLLAKGDRRDFVVIDPKGGVHSLTRRIDGARAAEVREKMAGVDPQGFLSISDATQVQLDRQAGFASTYDQMQWEDRVHQAAMEADRREREQDDEDPRKEQSRVGRSGVEIATPRADMAAQQREANRMFERRQEEIRPAECDMRPAAPSRQEREAQDVEDALAEKLGPTKAEILTRRFKQKAAHDREQTQGQAGGLSDGVGGGGGGDGGGGSR